MPERARLLPALLLLSSACAEDSSFVLRWRVGRTEAEAEDSPLTSVRQCSDLGLGRVRVTTTRADDNREEDVREFPCFPDAFAEPDGVAPGPELAAGTYYVYVTGLTRRGLTRPDPDDPDDDDKILARDAARVVVNERGEGQVVDSFRLFGVDECHDGIDNDLDGAVDQSDAPCRRGLAFENLDNAGAQFTFTHALLPSELDPEGNPNATCDRLAIDAFRLTLDGDPAQTRDIACSTITQGFQVDLKPGEHDWRITALFRGVDRTVPLPLDGPQSFTVVDDTYVTVPIHLDLGIDTFLLERPGQPSDPEPTYWFDGTMKFGFDFLPFEGAELERQCAPNDGSLVIDRVAVRVTDDQGDDVALDLDDMQALPLTDGVCEDFQQSRTTSELQWRDEPGLRAYRLVVEAFAAGDPDGAPCFSNAAAPEPLAPHYSPNITLPRVRSDGACSDCPQGNECAGTCDNGVCKP